jgi:hypothetical protein
VNRRLLGLSAAALAVVSSACGPKPGLEVGVKDYPTSIIFGGKKKPVPLPPLPVIAPSPYFPSFIEPPAPLPVDLPPPPPPPPPPACKMPNLVAEVPAVPAAATDGPKDGTYTYTVAGFTRQGVAEKPLPAKQVRTIKRGASDAVSITWDVATATDSGTYSVTYALLHPLSDSSLDGLYIRRVVTTDKTGAVVEAFDPTGEGLRIFAQPAANGTSWNSGAADPLRGTSMRLAGVVKEKERLNICGTIVEAWSSVVSIDIDKVDPLTGDNATSHIDATYTVAPQYGAMIIADKVKQRLGHQADNGDVHVDTGNGLILAQYESVIDNLSPR